MSTRAPKHQRFKAIGFVVRLLAVAIVIGSLLAILAPLGAASGTQLCTMECCIGKTPHLAGECSTGFLKPAKRPQPELEILCGSPLSKITPAKTPPVKIETVSVDEDAASCGMHADAEPQAGPGSKPPGLFVRTLSAPCAADCGAYAASNTVNRKPREQSAVAWAALARPPTTSHSFGSFSNPIAALRGHFEQGHPRGPPTSLA